MGTLDSELKLVRKNFGRLSEVAVMPNLIDVQRLAYEDFLQTDIPIDQRKERGLQAVLKSVFPISDYSKTAELQFVKYDLDEPSYTVDECQQRGATYCRQLKVTLRLIVWNIEEETGVRSVRDIKEQQVYMGDIPIMTDRGTFMVNGTTRVVVSQMHRSPGVFFDHDSGKTHTSGKYLFSARVIPYRGSWIDFEFDHKDMLYARIDRKRKIPITTFLLCLPNTASQGLVDKAVKTSKEIPHDDIVGMTREEILHYFYRRITLVRTKHGWQAPFDAKRLTGIKLVHDLIDARTRKVHLKAGERVNAAIAKRLVDAGVKDLLIPFDDLSGRYIADDMINEKTGEIYFESGDEINEQNIELLKSNNIDKIVIFDIDHIHTGSYLVDTFNNIEKNDSRLTALLDIYKILRPGEPPSQEASQTLFYNLFFNPDRYDLSDVGRVKLNSRLGVECEDTIRVLRTVDILEIIRVLLGLRDGEGAVDDIDHLSNRRVRSVGELLENQYRVGLVRMERAIRERMSSVQIETVMPSDLVNAKPAANALKEFFTSSQLSQFMDQTNPLAEITHKRRLSALGPGGLTRERAGFEVRDVHTSHYGRICPIETPEGPNIGLINSLATYARINKYGFIETPYRKVVSGKVTNEVVYLSAVEEDKYTIAQANAKINENNSLVGDLINCRKGGGLVMSKPESVNYIDVSPKQLVSVAASLIPFLENDDANRALMGSNMMRQAVPLLRPEAPFIGTGMESVVARESGVTVTAARNGIVNQVDSRRIVVHATEKTSHSKSGVDIYKLQKFQRSNQSTSINQRPLVKAGDTVKAGEIIADGPSTRFGELALGRNVFVAFMPWNGYNFEDSILISESLVHEDVFTSIHIEEFEVLARDTKLGEEEITRDIPNVGEDALRQLDEAGIVHIGAEVHPQDILVGKVTPKGESPVTPEEKLLRAIFGEKAADVRDTSLKVPPGVSGTVVEVRIFTRRGVDKDERAQANELFEIKRLMKDRDDEKKILETSFNSRLKSLLLSQTVASGIKGLKAGSKITEENLETIPKSQWRKVDIQDNKAMSSIEELRSQFEKSVDDLNDRFNTASEKITAGDDLPPGVMKMVKVFVAVKRKLQAGDKMSGRHGNKGVISRIIPVEDMPYTESGRPVDIVLNPLGVPSRMNVGQILETHLGWASVGIGEQINQLINNFKKDKKGIEELKTQLKEFYGKKAYQENCSSLDSNNIDEFSEKVKRGVHFATPVFDGANEKNIVEMLEKSNLLQTGQTELIDGLTGEKFERSVTVGYIYMLKLHHLADDKIHARSTGPYSLVTQQPLGGKAQFGGQRFGEMEVWALEAYGAAYSLQEILTVKSDDVAGRTKAYETIVKGEDNFESGIPESFNVLVMELKSLGLNVETLTDSKNG
jgi:DNA-directed RNA polymerase subunit beta